MDLATIAAIRNELESALVGRQAGKLFQLSKTDIAIDFRLPDSKYLFISAQPGNPRTYLIRRRLRELERASINPGPFILVLRKRLSAAEVTSVSQLPAERVLIVKLECEDEQGNAVIYSLVIQLTGTSANVFLLDDKQLIVEALRPLRGDGQGVGDKYEVPIRPSSESFIEPDATTVLTNLSETLDAEDQQRATADRFRALANSARSKLKAEISKRRRLIGKLHGDLASHGDAEQWKRFGDLLLANATSARREGNRALVIDYFDDAAPEIEIDVDENETLTDAAERYFKRYTKARNAGKEIETRLVQIERELKDLESQSDRVEAAIAGGDEGVLGEIVGAAKRLTQPAKIKKADSLQGVRRFASSDGFEILVGKKAKDNDFLTFRIAKSLDTWMHAADYPGSHVVIRNQNRKDIPHRTLVEAAQLAAFYSQGKTQPKAAVHYTQKKFVNKPKGSAPGLVSLASFKTLLVEPKVGEATLKTD